MVKRNLKVISAQPDYRAELDGKLRLAHSRIEKAFLDGGAVLVSVMEILNGLVDILDRLTGALDGKKTASTIDGLRQTVADLASLPQLAETRQSTFNEISEICHSTFQHVQDMQESIRYLRTFAITVKITGAGLAGFGEFADEIRDRIQSGAMEVDKFGGQLALMRSQLDKARTFSQGIRQDFDATIPQIVTNLNQSSGQIAKQHEQMVAVAAQVKAVTRNVQNKIATVLSALQIGDITRQRIEHIQSALEMFDAFVSSPDGAGLSGAEIDTLQNAIFHLAHAQLDETLGDFRQQCRSIFTNISSFTENATQILVLRDKLTEQGSGEDQNALKAMEVDMRNGCQLANRVQERSLDSDAVVGSVTKTAHELLMGIEVIRAIKTDIHYMALNSNLRCSRLGDEGRSVNVVSGELRTFAARLETPADSIVTELHRVETATQYLASEASVEISNIAGPLQDALSAIQGVSAEMEKGLGEFASEGQAVFSRISAAVTKLDFESELGDVLNECLSLAADLSPGNVPDLSGLAEKTAPLSAQIYRIYTMAHERDIHARYLPSGGTSALVEEAPKAAIVDDEDLFADALF